MDGLTSWGAHTEWIQGYVNQTAVYGTAWLTGRPQPPNDQSGAGAFMQPLVMLGIVLVVLWAVLWLGLKLATGFIHLVLIVGLAFVIWGLIKRGVRAIT